MEFPKEPMPWLRLIESALRIALLVVGFFR